MSVLKVWYPDGMDLDDADTVEVSEYQHMMLIADPESALLLVGNVAETWVDDNYDRYDLWEIFTEEGSTIHVCVYDPITKRTWAMEVAVGYSRYFTAYHTKEVKEDLDTTP